MKKHTLSAMSAALICSSVYAKDTVAVYDLHGAISESGAQSTSPLALLSGGEQSITHLNLVESLNSAIKDQDVKAIVLDVDDASLNIAQVQEVRRLLLKAREKKKDVWLYTEYYNTTTALLGSACSHFTLMPAGDNSLRGLHSETMYFKNLLDKAGLKMDVVHIGDFKSAGEQFYRTGPSAPAQKQTSLLLDSLFEQIVNQIAEGRGVKKEVVQKIINSGNVTAKDLLEAKLVDHLDYRTDIITKIRKQYAGAEFDKNYALPNTDGPEINGIMDIIKLFSSKSKSSDKQHPYIAIVPLEGNISDASIAPVRKAILDVTKDKNCKGLVLRVDSPGGSALSSEVLWEATDEFKKTKRPFIVSMGSVAASGGYYVAASADTIYAEKGTITGSIGVVGMKPVLGGGFSKLGVTFHTNKRGKHADLYNTSRGYTDEERKIITDSMLDVYGVFKKRITDGRGNKLVGEIEKLAGGRVYSGTDALKVGLVDKIGGLDAAIKACAKQTKLEHIHTHMFPEPKSAIESLFAKPSQKKDDEFIQTTRTTASNKLSVMLLKNDILNLVGDQKKTQIGMFIQQLESVQSHHIQLIAPADLNINMK